MRASVIVVGGINVDVKGRMSSTASELATSHPGVVWRTPGGVGHNIAVNLARLGCPVEFLGPFGADEDGQMLKRALEQSGVGTTWSPVLPGERSGTYLALLRPDGELVAAVSDMAIMDAFTGDRVSQAADAFQSASVVCLDANLTTDALECGLRMAQTVGAVSVVEPVSVAKAQKLKPLLPLIHTMTPNLDELAAIADGPATSMDDVRRLAASLVAEGVQRVVVTLGKNGVGVADANGWMHVPVQPLHVTDATGAGDAFTAGVVYGYHQNWPFDKSVRYGQTLAARVLTSTDSVLGGAYI